MAEEVEQVLGDNPRALRPVVDDVEGLLDISLDGARVSIDDWQDMMVKVCTEDMTGNEEWFDPVTLEAVIEWVYDSMWDELMNDVPPTRVHEEVLRRFMIRLGQ